MSKRSKRSKSFLAVEAITAFVDSEEWQLGEIRDGIAELDSGKGVSHDKVTKWLKTWGKPGETKAPREDYLVASDETDSVSLRKYIAKDSEPNSALVPKRIIDDFQSS